MSQIELAMCETIPTKLKISQTNFPLKSDRPRRECRRRKRPFDFDSSTTKRVKSDDQIDFDDETSCQFVLASDTDDENDSESKCSTIDDPTDLTTIQPLKQIDDNSDLEELEDETVNNNYSKISSDQHRNVPVVSSQQILNLTRHSKRLIGQFKYLYNHGIRKAVQPTLCPIETNFSSIENEKFRCELRNTFNRFDLFKEGFAVLSIEQFDFYSLCYLCGSMGNDLIYCQNCCEPFHPNCLNAFERARFHPSIDSWLCPNCRVCSICGLFCEPTNNYSRLNSTNETNSMISCCDCEKTFHLKCLKRNFDEIRPESNTTTSSAVSLSRLTHSFILNELWTCPTCVKCDCGQDLTSNERNLLSLGKTSIAQQSLMCNDCSNNFKFLRLHKNDQIDRCVFCEKFIEQILIKNQNSSSTLFQCSQCQHRFHPKCDQFVSEDVLLLLSTPIVCSKCDQNRHEQIRRDLNEFKRETIENLVEKLFVVVRQISSNDRKLSSTIERDFQQLKHLHQSRQHHLNLHAFLIDICLLIQRFFSHDDLERWQSVINGCILRQCPWFKCPTSFSLPSICSSSSFDHIYSLRTFTFRHQQIQRKKNSFSTPHDSFLRFLEEKRDENFTNFRQNDTRKCQLCSVVSDHSSSIIGRLISFGLNQWVHVGCILPAYAKNLDQPPYILRNIRETILRCQTKYLCSLCSKFGASVHCIENECYQRYHCDCIQKYYSTWDKNQLETLKIRNGFLPNLTTLCLRHNGVKNQQKQHRDSAETINDENVNQNGVHPHPKIKSVNTSHTVYGDLSNATLEFSLNDLQICIGSLQIQSFGDFDYLIEQAEPMLIIKENYPNNYRASRLFWSLNDPRHKTIYHLQIQVEQTYHDRCENHQTISYPRTDEQLKVDLLYDAARQYFEKFQKKIDEHFVAIEEFCQKTMVNKKSKDALTNASRRKTNQTGSVGTTKRLPKATPSCVKRQTPKAALKNVSRPRNRFAHGKQTMNQPTVVPPIARPAATTTTTKDLPINDIQNLFNKACLKDANLSEIALAIAQALTQAAQPPLPPPVPPSPNKLLISGPTSSLAFVETSNGSKTDKDTDGILKQLLKNISTTTAQTHEIPTVLSNPPQWRTTISSVQQLDDLRTNGHSPHTLLIYDNSLKSSPSHPSENSSSESLTKKMTIPQFDGCIDDETDDDQLENAVIKSLIEQILSQIDSDSTNVSTSIPIRSPPIAELVQAFKTWSKAIRGRVQFIITNDEGFHFVSDDLDSAWSNIIEKIRTTRDDLNLPHLSMNNEQLNGHQMFGLTKPIVHTILNHLYTQSSPSKSSTNSNIALPLSSSISLANIYANASSTLESLQKKHTNSSSLRTNFYERKHRERQRFGWLLNQSRKIDYALKSLDIDEALIHSRRILLEEASVSLRLYHLRYFSSRALLVGSSPIHGCGLFTLIDLVEGQMIVEYTGEVVRPCLTDKRERENEGKGFGCYMFTVDSMHVIDATHRGNKARFINHNCTPNCFAKTVLSGGVKHIVIYALVDIPRGSELTYDYSFPEEDVKIPCHCGTSQCRIYLN